MMSSPNIAHEQRKHSHYFKSVSGLKTIDVYRVLELFGVTDQAIGHAIKKLLVAGGRGHKDIQRDIQDAIDTLERWREMRREDGGGSSIYTAPGIRATGVGALAGFAVPELPWISLIGHTTKPDDLLDDQAVKVKYSTGEEVIATAGSVNWAAAMAYQALEAD